MPELLSQCTGEWKLPYRVLFRLGLAAPVYCVPSAFLGEVD